jgi:hypothetical protein
MRILGIIALGVAAVLGALPAHAATANCSDAVSTLTGRNLPKIRQPGEPEPAPRLDVGSNAAQ